MSLKSFHLLFIGASILLSIGCLYAAARTFIGEPSGGHLGPVVLAAAILAGLAAYGIRANRRFRSMGDNQPLE